MRISKFEKDSKYIGKYFLVIAYYYDDQWAKVGNWYKKLLVNKWWNFKAISGALLKKPGLSYVKVHINDNIFGHSLFIGFVQLYWEKENRK